MSEKNMAATPMTYHVGNKKIFTKVFNQYYLPIKFFANTFLDDREQAEDIVAEVFEKLWTKGHQFETVGQLRAWLYTSTRNACFNYIKAQQNKNNSKSDLSVEISENVVLDRITKAELIIAMRRYIEQLPPACKKVIKLRLEGHSNQEVSGILKISVSTVKNQSSRAGKIIRGKLTKDELLVLAVFFSFFGD